MAVRVVSVVAGTPHPVDGLSACCYSASLIEVPLLSLTPHGVSQLATWLVCADCRTRTARAA